MAIRTEEEEIKELLSAVEHFAQAMRIKLLEEAKNGKRGWDGAHPERDLCSQIVTDADSVYFESGNESNLAVDIGNRAMMIWYRHYGEALMHGD